MRGRAFFSLWRTSLRRQPIMSSKRAVMMRPSARGRIAPREETKKVVQSQIHIYLLSSHEDAHNTWCTWILNFIPEPLRWRTWCSHRHKGRVVPDSGTGCPPIAGKGLEMGVSLSIWLWETLGSASTKIQIQHRLESTHLTFLLLSLKILKMNLPISVCLVTAGATVAGLKMGPTRR